MAGNMEGNDSRTSENARLSADLTSVGFTHAEQREVVNKIAQSQAKDVSGFHLDNNEKENPPRKMIEQPHAWYEGSKSYGLPSEAAITGSNVEQTLRAGWRNQHKQG